MPACPLLLAAALLRRCHMRISIAWLINFQGNHVFLLRLEDFGFLGVVLWLPNSQPKPSEVHTVLASTTS